MRVYGADLLLVRKRAMEIGMAPFKGLMQAGFMMWMSGNTVNIFSIMVTGMIIMNTIKAFFNMQTGAWVRLHRAPSVRLTDLCLQRLPR